MQSNEPIFSSPPPTSSPTNKHSIISLILGILTVFALCGGMVPVPFTGFICFPTSFFLGLLALIYGGISLNTIRRKNETGSVIVSLFVFAPESVPPFLEGYQIL
jgi:hypothetical protein